MREESESLSERVDMRVVMYLKLMMVSSVCSE